MSSKKGTHTFFGPNIETLCQKISTGSKKKYEFQKTGTHTFFEPNIVPKKVWDPKKSMSSKRKGTHTFGDIFAGTFFLFELKISSNKKKVPGKTDFAGTFFFV